MQANVEIYRAEAQVYEYRLKSVLAVYDIYRAQVQALESQVNVDRARVEVFSTQANAYAAVANAYRAVIDGVAAKAQIEKLRVDCLRRRGAGLLRGGQRQNGGVERVPGGDGSEHGKDAGLPGAGAGIHSGGGRLQGSGRGVGKRRSGPSPPPTKGRRGATRQRWTGTAPWSPVAARRWRAEIKSYQVQLEQYKAQVQAKETSYRLSYENTKARNETALASYKTTSDVVLTRAQMDYKRMSDLAHVAVQGAGVYGSMASSALAGMNSLAASMESKSL